VVEWFLRSNSWPLILRLAISRITSSNSASTRNETTTRSRSLFGRPRRGADPRERGWVPTKIGGPGAPDDMAQAPETQVWLAVSDDPRATVSGRYFYHKSLRDTRPAASDIQVQNGLLRACEEFTGVTLPSANSRSERSR
jgi:hypothetical protein